jgi:hypothetical protein
MLKNQNIVFTLIIALFIKRVFLRKHDEIELHICIVIL